MRRDPGNPLLRRRWALCAAVPLLALAQQSAPPPAQRPQAQSQVQPATAGATFTVSANLVIEEVSVKDKSGKADRRADQGRLRGHRGRQAADHRFLRIPEHRRGGARAPEPRAERRAGSRPAPPPPHPSADRAGGAGQRALPQPQAAGAVFRYEVDAAGGSVPRARCGAEVPPQPDEPGGRGGHYRVRWRKRPGAPGFHRRPGETPVDPRVHGRQRAGCFGGDAMRAPPIPARPSARTIPSSTSSIPTANWPPCRRPRKCWARSTKRRSWSISPAECN